MITILKHQEKSLINLKKFLKRKKRGLLLFHSLGSGKTITTLNIISYLIKNKKINCIYLIAPKYLFDIWKNESNKLSLNYLKYFKFIDINNINDIINISSNLKSIIIIDEAHIILSNYIHSAKYDKMIIYKLYQKLYSCYFTIYITATPIVKSITDLNIFENLCSNKKLFTNDKNLYPEYFTYNKVLYILFNKIFPILTKYTFKAPYFTIINIISTFILIYIEIHHDSFFDNFNKLISYLKYRNNFFGKYIFLPLKRNIEKKYEKYSSINCNEEIKKDDDYFEYKTKYLKESFQKENGKINEDYLKIKNNILRNSKIAYFIKIFFGIYYSLLTIIDLIRNSYIHKNKLMKFNYKKFLKNINSIDKYFVYNDSFFPKKIVHNIYIELNELQTQKNVEAIVNKDFIIKNCDKQNYILCNLYNINYDDVPIDKILQISNLYHSKKFDYVLKIIKLYSFNIVISCRYEKNSFDILQLYLKSKNITFKFLTPSTEKDKIIKDFEENKFQILILHPNIIEGISIKKTKAIILLDVCTKYNIEQQVIGRCIRYNSHKYVNYNEVHIYKLITIFKKKILIKYLKRIDDPSQSFDELLNDKKKIKFLSFYKTADQIFEESNNLIEKIYNNL